MVRLVTVAVLLGTAGVAVWSGPVGCAPPPASPTAPAARPAAPPHPDRTEQDRAQQDGAQQDGAAARSGSEVLAVPPGFTGVPVRLAEQVATALLRPGDRVSLFAAGGSTTPIADDAVVLAVTAAGDVGVDAGVLVALRPADARRALGTPQRTGFAVTVRSGR